jgi:polyisoprenoid-binding protein YceI
VGKAGLFSAAGHEHWVSAPIGRGSLDDAESPHILFTIAASKLRVEADASLSDAQQTEIQRTMQEKVLESEKYPEISFCSSSIERTGDDSWTVRGELSLHGQTHPVNAVVRKQSGRFVGECRIKQTDFGIQPIRVAGGTVKVKNELDISFTIVPTT